MKKKLLKDSHSVQKHIHELAIQNGASKVRLRSKKETEIIERADDIALERIRHNVAVQNSEIENMGHVLYLKKTK